MRCAVLVFITVLAVISLCHAEEQQIEDVENRKSRGKKQGRDDTALTSEKTDTSEADQKQYNQFIDTVFRRLGSSYRSRSAPLSLRIAEKTNKGHNKSGKNNDSKKGNKKGSKSNKGSNKEKKDKNKKSGSKKKAGRHPKDLKIDEVVPVNDNVAVEEETHREKRDIEEDGEFVIEINEHEFAEIFGEETLKRVARDIGAKDEGEEEDHPVAGVNRSGKPAKAKKEATKKSSNKGVETKSEEVHKSRGTKSGGKKKSASKKNGGHKNSNKRNSKKNDNKSNNKSAKSGSSNRSRSPKKSRDSTTKSSGRSPRATITGFGSIARSGDVKIISRANSREIRSSFETGPITAKITSSEGTGKDKVDRTARATADSMHGKIYIEVFNDGKTDITKFGFDKTNDITIEGNFGRSGKEEKFMKRAFSRLAPSIARKLRFATKDILKESITKKKA